MSERSLLRASVAISAVAVASVVVLVALIGVRSERSSSKSAAGSAVEPAATPAQPVRQAPKPKESAPTQSDVAFWRLIAETRSAADNDTGRQSELLKDRLTRLPPQGIVEFARMRHRLDQGAYTWSLWGAATVIEDGCSADCFRDFRAYLISLGPGPYERALRNPDSLASVARDAESGDWENADNVAPDAYSSVTGRDFPLNDSDLSGPPAGRPVDLNSAALVSRYPRLAARFRRA